MLTYMSLLKPTFWLGLGIGRRRQGQTVQTSSSLQKYGPLTCLKLVMFPNLSPPPSPLPSRPRREESFSTPCLKAPKGPVRTRSPGPPQTRSAPERSSWCAQECRRMFPLRRRLPRSRRPPTSQMRPGWTPNQSDSRRGESTPLSRSQGLDAESSITYSGR